MAKACLNCEPGSLAGGLVFHVELVGGFQLSNRNGPRTLYVGWQCQADNKRIYWESARPIEGIDQKETKIWYADRISGFWGEPKLLEGPINWGEKALYVTISSSGTIYFQGRRSGGYGESDIYRSIKFNGVYQEPENLGPIINSQFDEGDVLIAPDESFLVFNTSRPGGYGKGGLYISFKTESGSWQAPINLGPEINSDQTDFCPMLSPDGKYFFYSSLKTGDGDIYWVDIKFIEQFR
jgi:hypothetical protein